MTYADVLDAHDKGRHHIAPFRKYRSVSSYSTADLSYGAGIPIANYYASTPLVMADMVSKEGIFHGVSTGDKYLHKTTVQQTAGSVGELYLMDYISYVPFFDGDSTGVQTFEGHTLPRFADGVGVNVMLVSQGAGQFAGNVVVTYTNQLGISNRTATTYVDPSIGAGGLITFRSLFMQLQQGDLGVRSVESVQLLSALGGIFAIVFAKIITTVVVSDILAPIEVDYFAEKGKAPVVHKDAYLNYVFRSGAGVTANIQAQLEFIW